MIKDIRKNLIKTYTDSLQPPYIKGARSWIEENVVLPPAYAITGKVDFGLSPYLLRPLADLDNPKIMQINLCMATQVGKSLVTECAIPYWIVNAPGPIFRIFNNDYISKTFAETRLLPLLKSCEPIKPLLNYSRFSTRNTGINLPHMSIILRGANDGMAHGMSVKYLICDEIHEWDVGMFNKFLARTTAFAGRRKILVASQPNKAGSEWDIIAHKGVVYEWQWQCPECKTRQPYRWSHLREDGTYSGFNWDSILNKDESTNILESSKTTWLECDKCRHKVHDTPTERRLLNDTGNYVCVKSDGDPSMVTYTAPIFVNINLSYQSVAAQYMIAKKFQGETTLDEQMEIFVTQVLGRFYHRDEHEELSKILVEIYDKENLDKDWVTVMGVDVQRTGKIKYWCVRSFHKSGNESKRLDFGIARTWDDVEAIRKKYNVPLPLVHVDSGDGETVYEVYQECIKHGQVLKVGTRLEYISWTPCKGDQKVSYPHPDGIDRLYSKPSYKDCNFPLGHKLKGIPAPLVVWSNYGIKTILAALRDRLKPGIKWVVDIPDEEYDKQMYSEGLFTVVDKKSGMKVKRWLEKSSENHYFDAECLCLLGAVRAGAFSSVKVNEDELKKIIADKDAKNLTSAHSKK